jgi:hypothetical protein
MCARVGFDLEPEPKDRTPVNPSDYLPPPVLGGLVEDRLLRQGWRLEHPAIRGVLIGPDGQRIDAVRSVTITRTGFDLEPLQRSWTGRPVGVEIA